MNKKEEEILQEIINYFKENYTIPTRRYLQKTFNYKSVNSITQYINSLVKQNYLKRNRNGKLILNTSSVFYNNSLKTVKIINANEKYINIELDKRKKYLAYIIHNDYFYKQGIMRNDLLIIKLCNKLNIDDLGLFIIDKKYRIMKYDYKDGFYILKDNEELLLNKVKIIGKVIMIERKL